MQAFFVAWLALRCAAYSPAADGYACADFELTSDDTGARDPARVRDVTRWVQRRPASWGGRRGLALVTGDSRFDDGATRLVVAEREYTRRAPLRRRGSMRRVLAEAAAAGYTTTLAPPVSLVPGQWVPAAGVWLRFDTRFHEGDASAYAIGHVFVRCTAPATPADATTGSTDLITSWPRGEEAVVHHAAGAPSFALSLLEHGGGEGSGYVRSRTLVVRRDRVCPAR